MHRVPSTTGVMNADKERARYHEMCISSPIITQAEQSTMVWPKLISYHAWSKAGCPFKGAIVLFIFLHRKIQLFFFFRILQKGVRYVGHVHRLVWKV